MRINSRMADDIESPVLSKATFYSDLNGTSKGEISLILSINPASVFLRASIQLLLCSFGFTEGLILQVFLDFAVLTLPLCLSVTLLSDGALHILLTEVALSFSLLFLAIQIKSTKHKYIPLKQLGQTPMEGRLPFITNFRVLNNIGVAVGILAVDFVVFPRRFAKTETFGTGIMDGGVGAYVLMNAIVSPEARGQYQRSGLKPIMKSLTSSLPLLVIGLGRLVSVKGIDYHEHVSEYGLHWNFFFTLAATKILCTLILLFTPVSWSAVISLSLAVGYQVLLTQHGLEDLVLHGTDLNDSREGFFNANREGLVSCLGYVAIYFAGVRLGQYLLQPRKIVSEWLKVLAYLLLADVILWITLKHVEARKGLTSRRLANLPYVIWNVAYCLHVLCGFLLIDIIMTIIRHHYLAKDKSRQLSLLVSAIGRNQLLYFLLANVLTGLVNLSIDTIHQPDVTAFGIVALYLFVLNFVLVFFHQKNISTKFW
ncbi:phosphatidylinositol-glycan biosynthesis class W protein [Strongylocentrotus purpuratus]|uniref:Phosphatidylinositol-glycan biosynthesis class W protein n=1 Tax=Strongylocentrotus purpuratus TaxID=7668 RepID=A0A7M7RD88_STRPU|nr:phosphatidylinositol-glycan biosynthesis class W protein [Strongylocentrotus purpuratus]|eukprot:XP_791509.3 PREDICTED: phosphatidylinositol-glycan biosynthesis class W protein [Strongylocentrotus purpuratus]